MTGNNHSNNSLNLEMAHSNQDLIISKGRKKKRTWITAGIVCLVVIALIVTALVLLTNGETKQRRIADGSSLTLEDLLGGSFYAKSFNASWISDNEALFTDEIGNLVIFNVEENKSTILVPFNDPVRLASASDAELSPDRKYILFSHDYQKLYRYSHRARRTIVNLKTGGKNTIVVDGNEDLQLVKWAPVGNSLVIVSRNNVYYKRTAEDEPVQITNDHDGIQNGVADWVYEEEVFNSDQAVWFSPDAKKIVFAKFDDTKVPFMVLPIYGEPGSIQFQYPRANVIKYPKAGTPNPVVNLFVVNLDNVTDIRKLDQPAIVANKQPILTALSWANNNSICAIWMNRVQNEASITLYETEANITAKQIKHLHEEKGWLELFTAPLFNKEGTQMIMILSSDQGGNLGGYRHVTLLNALEDADLQPLTKGTFVVTDILGWDEKNNLVYYKANTPENSAAQHIYSVHTVNKKLECLSCNLLPIAANRTTCAHYSAHFSKDFSYMYLKCGGPDVPTLAIYKTGKEPKKVLDWETNEELFNITRSKTLPQLKRLKFGIAGGFEANVVLKLPPNFDDSGSTKYPLLVNVYGGPDSSQVSEAFNLDWGSYLAANASIIYAAIDGRASGLRGDKLLFSNYRNIGTAEVEDQINVTRQIQKSLPYIDASKTAIWGWSYGGYAAGMALATDKNNVFKCGMSVAPVTDWKLYDSIYTERFMGLPTIEDNYKGYKNSLLLDKYEGIRNKEYFLIHGTYDDNVHYQQSALWAKVLEEHDILFRQHSYPDQAHDLGSVRSHLYHSLEQFLHECFAKKE